MVTTRHNKMVMDQTQEDGDDQTQQDGDDQTQQDGDGPDTRRW
jgi:hypothetical protein